MKIHKSTYQQMDDLFKEARQDKPLMSLKEVEKIVHTGEYIPTGVVRRFHVGINTLIIVSGIIVSSLLTYFTLRQDQPKQVITNNIVEQVAPVQNPVAEPQQTASVNIVKPRVEPPLTKVDKQRPAVKTDNFVASTENNVVAENTSAVENTVADNSEANKNEAVEPVEAVTREPLRKMSFVEFNTLLVYLNDSFIVRQTGDEVTMVSKNNQIIPKEKWGEYEEVINAAKLRNSGKSFNNGDNSSMELISFLDSQLHSDKILPGDVHYVFELSSSELLINKQAQDKAVFKKYKKYYEDKTGQVVTKGSVYRFEKGTKSEGE